MWMRAIGSLPSMRLEQLGHEASSAMSPMMRNSAAFSFASWLYACCSRSRTPKRCLLRGDDVEHRGLRDAWRASRSISSVRAGSCGCAVSAQPTPAIVRGLPSVRPRTNMREGLVVDELRQHLDERRRFVLVRVRRARRRSSESRPGPILASFCERPSACRGGGSLDRRMSVISRSAFRFEKKLIQPCRGRFRTGNSCLAPGRMALRDSPHCRV